MLKKRLQIITTLLILLLSPTNVFAATVGHGAPYISTGMFESGNYTFPDSLFIKEYFNVSDLFWVDPVTSRVGIGTTNPAYLLQIEGTTNTTGLRTEGLSHFLSNVTISDNLTVTGTGGDALYVDASSGMIGIGTSSPGDAKLNITGTVDAWHMTINGTAVGTISGWTDDGTIIRLTTSTDSVGIGTASPTALLHLENSSAAVANAYLNISDGETTKLIVDPAGNIIQSVSAYINYGTTIGSAGYGIRDNAGTIQRKNNAGEWGDIATVSASAGGWTDGGTSVYLTTGTDIVGIGTSTPEGGALYVAGNGTYTGDLVMGGDLVGTEGSGASGAGLLGWTDDGTVVRLATSTDSVGIGTSSPGARLEVINDSAYEGLLLNITNGATDFVYNATTGNVGIGTTNPGLDLVVERTAATGSGSGGRVGATSNNGSVLVAGDRLGIYALGGYDGDTIRYGASIASYASEEWTPGSSPADMIFDTAANGTTTRTERMRITSTGNVGIGTTSPGATLEVVNASAVNNILNVSRGDDMLVVNATGIDLDTGTLYVDPINNYVGIGTTTPGSSLEVSGSGNTEIRITSGAALNPQIDFYQAGAGTANAFIQYMDDGDYLRIADNGVTGIVQKSGNVGIGTTTPSMILDVNGDANLTGTTYIGNSTLYVSGSAVGIGTTNTGGAKLYASGTIRSGAEGAAYLSSAFTADAGYKYVLLGTTFANGTNFTTAAPGSDYVSVLGLDYNGVAFYTQPTTGGSIDRQDTNDTFNSYERMRIDQNGNVGIGTISPGATLEVVNSSAVNALFNVTDGNDTRFIINGAGNVGIGTDAPSVALHVQGSGEDSSIVLGRAGVPTATAIWQYNIDPARFGTVASDNLLIIAGNTTAIHVNGDSGIGRVGIGVNFSGVPDAQLEIIGDLNVSLGANFATTSGNVGIGTTTPGSKLVVAGNVSLSGADASFHDSSMPVIPSGGDVFFDWTTGEFGYLSSCLKYKENVIDLELGLETVKQLRPVSFDWKDGGKRDIGFIAEDVEKINPILVAYYKGELASVQYTQIIPILTKAVQEQQTQIEDLKSENDALKELVCLDHPGAEVCKKGVASVQPVNETEMPSEQTPEVPVEEVQGSFGITGAAVSIVKQGAKQGSSSLLSWLRGLF